MGTTAEKLTYLNTTKGKIKDSINLTGANITTEPFRQYSTKLNSALLDIINNGTQEVWDNWEKVSASNVTSASLNQTVEAPMKLDLKGNTYQEENPTPDNPKDIHIVSGNNYIKVEGKNLFDKDNANVISAYFRDSALNQLVINSSNSNKTVIFKGEPNTTYTISKTLGDRFRVGLYNSILSENGTYVFDTNAIRNDSATSITITTTSTNYYIYIQIFETGNLEQTLATIQIEKGSSSSSYTPYVSQTYPINLPFELCKIGDYQDRIFKSSGKNLFNPSVATQNCTVNNGVITITSNSTDVYIQGAYSYTEANKFLTLEAGNYYIKSTNSNVRVTLYGEGGFGLDTSSTQPVNVSSTTKFGGIRIRSSSSLQNVSFGIMLSTEDTMFEPYGTDWYKYGAIGKVVLDGSESGWSADSQRYKITNIINGKAYSTFDVNTPLAYSNYFKWKNGLSGVFVYGAFWYLTNGKDLSMQKDENPNTTTLATFKTWLSTHNTTVYYVLATPTYTKITDNTLLGQLEAIKKSYNEQTNVSQTSNDLPFILDITALKEI